MPLLTIMIVGTSGRFFVNIHGFDPSIMLSTAAGASPVHLIIDSWPAVVQ